MVDPVVSAYFLVPTSPRTCTYAAQTDQEQRLKSIILPANSKVVIDFVLDWTKQISFSEVQFGFEGALDDKPHVLKYTNNYIRFGRKREVDPTTDDTDDYVDINYTYHVVKTKTSSPGLVQSFGFTVRTNAPGTYKLKIDFVGFEELSIEDLSVTVE